MGRMEMVIVPLYGNVVVNIHNNSLDTSWYDGKYFEGIRCFPLQELRLRYYLVRSMSGLVLLCLVPTYTRFLDWYYLRIVIVVFAWSVVLGALWSCLYNYCISFSVSVNKRVWVLVRLSLCELSQRGGSFDLCCFIPLRKGF